MDLKGIIVDERYQLLKLMGQGGMGQVWLAKDKQNESQQVAIKLAQDQYKDQLDLVKEANLMRRLEHPNIITIYYFGADPRHGKYYVMEYFPNGSLEQYIYSNNCSFAKEIPNTQLKYIPLAKAVEILRPIADALDHAHKRNLFHRDLKLSNILVDVSDNRYVLTDFNEIHGSAQIMSPEQLYSYQKPPNEKIPLDWRSDLYGFGCCLYKLVTGNYPFSVNATDPNEQVNEMYRYLLKDELPMPLPVSLNPTNSDLQGETINKLIARLVSKSRTRRTLKGELRTINQALDLLESEMNKHSTTNQNGEDFNWPIHSLSTIPISTDLTTVVDDNKVGISPFWILIISAVIMILAGIMGGVFINTPLSSTPIIVDLQTPSISINSGNGVLIAYPTNTSIPTFTSIPTKTSTSTPTLYTPTPSNSTLTPASEECKENLEILSPQFGETISNAVVFKGTVTEMNFEYYKIEYLLPDGENWQCCLVNPTYKKVENGELGTWFVEPTQYPSGIYKIRLMGVKQDGSFETCELELNLVH